MKKFFTFIACALVAMSANAKYDLSLEELSNGWGSTYDAATKTITYEADAWGGRGWGFSELGGTLFEFSDYDYLVVQISNATVNPKLVVEYTDGKEGAKDDGTPSGALKKTASGDVEVTTTDKYVALKLNQDQEYLIQAYIQNSTWQATKPNNPAGTISLTGAFLCTEKEYAAFLEANKPSYLWQGENDFGVDWDWGAHVSLSAAKFEDVKVDDVLKFTYAVTEAGDWHQIKALSNDKPLEGTKAEDINEYNCITVSSDATTYGIKLTENDVKNLKSSGLVLQGYSLVLKEVAVESQTTGISSAVVAPVANPSKIYNLVGQQVSKSYKGVVIKNGKKYVQ